MKATPIPAGKNGKRPVHPGEVLREEFIQPLGLTATGLANDLGIPPNRITLIMHGVRSVTAETAVLLARRLGTTAEFWARMQMNFDLAAAEKKLGKRR